MHTICETPRLRLREMTEADRPFLTRMLGNPTVMRYYPRPLSVAEVTEWIKRQQARYRNDGHSLWLVEDRQSGEPFGQVGLVKQQVESEWIIELGYMIHEPHWRKGIAREAAQACLEYGFQQLKCSEICSLIHPENIPSQKTAESLGMRRNRKMLFNNVEHWRYEISVVDWQPSY